MVFNPELHHRCSIRLKGYDYSANGAYFITIITRNRECFYENIIRSEKSLEAIRKYIIDNPLNWQTDSENPAAVRI